MQIRPRMYPHPVLAPHFSDDFPQIAYNVRLQVSNDTRWYYFTVSCEMLSNTIRELVQNRNAKYLVHIDCKATRFREAFTSFEEVITFKIPVDKLDHLVEVCTTIVADREIEDYRSMEFHPDFRDVSFRVNKGEVLAVGLDHDFMADKLSDSIKKIPSIFLVCRDTNPLAPAYIVDENDDKIIIKLSQENHARYVELSKVEHLRPLVSSALIILPALTSIIELLKDETQHDWYKQRRWFHVIMGKIEEDSSINLYEDHAVAIAQKLINDPMTHALKLLEDLVLEPIED